VSPADLLEQLIQERAFAFAPRQQSKPS
jgi:hypothetical protein